MLKAIFSTKIKDFIYAELNPLHSSLRQNQADNEFVSKNGFWFDFVEKMASAKTIFADNELVTSGKFPIFTDLMKNFDQMKFYFVH